ncbi:MAG: EAL domain-containing protein [Chloroflexota bacterium]
MPLAARALGLTRRASLNPRKSASATRGRWPVLLLVGVIGLFVVLALLRVRGLAWERLHEPASALVGFLISAGSITRGTGRVRQVRAWITFGFSAWTASQFVTALDLAIGGVSSATLSVVLLGGVLIAAAGAYWADLHGRVSRREKLAIYLDAAIVAAAVTALLLALFQSGATGTPVTLSPPVIQATLFLAILAATLILDLAVLAELRITGAYGILIGLAFVAFGFIGRSSGLAGGLEWSMSALVSLGVLGVALGTASWSDRQDENARYVRVAARLRGYLPLVAAGVTLVLLLTGGEGGSGPSRVVSDLSMAFVLAGTVGRQSLLLTERSGLLAETRKRSDQLERRLASQRQLLAITERLLVHRERTAVFEAVADTLAEVVPHDTLSIYLVDLAAGCLVPILARDEYAEQIMASRPLLGAGITGDVIAKGEAEIINDAENDPRVAHVPGTPTDVDESMIVAPIRNPEGVIGALNIYRAGRRFDAEDLELARLFTNHVAIALENATVHDQLLEAADKDPLTGLPNRRYFTERVEDALIRRMRNPGPLAVLFLDIDGFKLVNDSLGHAAGDEALRAVAERLQECTRETDTVARLGGDEFAILCEDVHTDANAIATTERIVAALARPLLIQGRAVAVLASIGIALQSGQNAKTAVELLRDADTAMYRAKVLSRGGFQVFEESMHAHQLARLQLEGDLEQAVNEGQFRLVYQPILDLATMQVVGVEALLRWDHPTRKIEPQEFIKLAEESGRIIGLGRWVRREACRQVGEWQRDHVAGKQLGLAVNISARELVDGTFVKSVEHALADSGLAHDHLTLEITESMMLSDETVTIAALRQLRGRGVHVAVDDFGTGYSSLSYLKRLPVDGLKIDRSFIEGLGVERETSAIVRATIAFARALGLVVTAEGLEKVDQLDRLQAMGCDLGQGYYFAAPLESNAMGDLLASMATNPGRFGGPPAELVRKKRTA